MSNEYGPFKEAVKVVTFNPDAPTQVRKVSGAGSPAWVELVTAAGGTFAEYVTTPAQVGATGIYYADLPTGLDATRAYPIIVYGSTATAFSDSADVAEYSPENLPVNAKVVSDKTGYSLSAADHQLIADRVDDTLAFAVGNVVSTTGTTTTLDAGAVATANYYNGATLVITSGPGAGQERVITAYSAARVATHAAWTTNPTGASEYAIRGAASSGGGALDAGQDTKLTQIHTGMQSLKIA